MVEASNQYKPYQSLYYQQCSWGKLCSFAVTKLYLHWVLLMVFTCFLHLYALLASALWHSTQLNPSRQHSNTTFRSISFDISCFPGFSCHRVHMLCWNVRCHGAADRQVQSATGDAVCITQQDIESRNCTEHTYITLGHKQL